MLSEDDLEIEGFLIDEEYVDVIIVDFYDVFLDVLCNFVDKGSWERVLDFYNGENVVS